MKTEYHKWWSPSLNQDMELKVYGHKGRPFMIFPCSSGRFFDFEDRGMISVINDFIAQGRIKLFAVDSVDAQSWDNKSIHPVDRARRHNDYDKYIVEEVVPFIHKHNHSAERIIGTGTSMGASHAVNFFFRHPDVFGGTVAMSGLYNSRFFLEGYNGNELEIYYNSPLEYLPGLNDEGYLELYRDSDIVVSVGQGAWEDPMIHDTFELKQILEEKGIPAWIDFWGQDVNHDWPWWLKQFPYFVSRLV